MSATVADWLSLVRFSHSVFALPFALTALLVATDGRPGAKLLALVVAAVVAARTSAMAFNRYLDREIDAANPRTQTREIPRGAVSPAAALALTLVAGAAFLAFAFLIAPICGYLALPVLAVLLGYSWAKRFTSLAHLWLGIALGFAPPAAHLAARGVVDGSIVAPLLLGLAVSLWVAGFDVIYSAQDADFDRRAGLFSLPARLGVRNALRLAALGHALAIPLFAVFGWLSDLSWPYHLGVAVVAALLWSEHRLVRGGDLSRVDAAFFQRNALVSMLMLAATAIDLYWL